MNATCNGTIFLVPIPGGLKEGPKGQISYLLTNERYITYQMGFSFGPLGHAQGWDLGYCECVWGGGQKKNFRNSTGFGV